MILDIGHHTCLECGWKLDTRERIRVCPNCNSDRICVKITFGRLQGIPPEWYDLPEFKNDRRKA